jgi:hypothetical protein
LPAPNSAIRARLLSNSSEDLSLKTVFLAIILICLTGCAAKPPSNSFLETFKSTNQLDSLSMAALASPLKVTPSADLSTSLEASHRIVAYQGSRSFYRTVQVEAENDGQVGFTVKSTCACFGFDKRVAIPILLAFDSAGAPLPLSGVRYEVVRASGITPLRVVLSGRVHTAGAKTFRALLLADNSSLDTLILTHRLISATGEPIANLQVLSYPIGSLTLSLETPKPQVDPTPSQTR